MRIKDQRTITGGADAREIRRRWRDFIEQNGAPERDDERSLEQTNEVVAAYINHGRWVADCPNCNGGIAAWAENDACCCLDCGRVYHAVFPSTRKRDKVEAILLERPSGAYMNWNPDRESIADLKAESILRGFPVSVDDEPGDNEIEVSVDVPVLEEVVL